MPPTAAGPVPSLGLQYDSGSVDGRTPVTNNQTSVVGEGFELTSSYIERRYATCSSDGAPARRRDLCWRGEQLTLVLDGTAYDLVGVGPDEFVLASDDGTVVERLTGAKNGDDNGEHWRLRKPDGSTYLFGQNRLPGANASSVTNSAWTVPVFTTGTTSNDPAQAEACASAVCTQAWRWNLDSVEDLHGNLATYWYAKETNRYRRGGTTPTSYDRGGRLVAVDYGLRAGEAFDPDGGRGLPPQRAVLTYAQRCLASNCASLRASTRTRWPDVPFGLLCGAGQACTDKLAPTFFTRLRLTRVL
ncbi:MAG: hypothetical protein ACI379_07875, partial [Nocardioides sp.]